MTSHLARYVHSIEPAQNEDGQWTVTVRVTKKVEGVMGGDSRLNELPGTFATPKEAEEAGFAWWASKFVPW